MNYCRMIIGSGSTEFDSKAARAFTQSSKEDLKNYIKTELFNQTVLTDDFDVHIISKKEVIDLLNQVASTNSQISQEDIFDIIKNFDRYFSTKKITVDNTKRINFNNRAELLSTLNPELNSYIYQQMIGDLFKITVLNLGDGIWSGKDMNESIKTYKNDLFYTLVYWLADELPTKLKEIVDYNSLYVNNTDVSIDESVYQSIMKLAADKIDRLTQNGKINESLVSINIENEILNPFKAFYILNDFDNFIANISHGNIVIAPSQIGKLDIFGKKYSFAKENVKKGTFNDDFSTVSADDMFTNIFYSFIQTIQNGKKGMIVKADMQNLGKHIQQLLNSGDTVFLVEDPNDSENSIPVDLAAIVSGDTSPIESFQILMDAINPEKDAHGHRKLISKMGKETCYNLHSAFMKLFNMLQATLNDPSVSLEERREVEKRLDFCQQLVNVATQHLTTAYVALTPDGTQVKSISNTARGKETVYNRFRNRIKHNLSISRYQLFHPNFVLGNESDTRTIFTFKDIYDSSFRNYLKDLLDIDLDNNPSLQEKLTTQSGFNALIWFITELNSVIRNEVRPYRKDKNFERILDRALNKFKRTQEYVVFTNLLIEENTYESQKLYDQTHNPSSTQNNPNTIGSYAKNLQNFRINFTDSENILDKYKDLTTPPREFDKNIGYTDRILYRQDLAYGNGSYQRYVAARQLTDKELGSVAINFDFLDSIQRLGVALNQIECVSDKPRIPLGAFNIFAEMPYFKEGGTAKMFYELTYDEMKDLYKKQHTSFYTNIEKKLISDYSKLFGQSFATLEDAIAELEKLTYEQFYYIVKDYNEKNPHLRIEIQDQVHYSNGIGNLQGFNQTLYANIAAAHNENLLDTMLEDGFQDTVNFLETSEAEILVDIIDQNRINGLFSDCTEAELKEFFGKKKKWVRRGTKTSTTELSDTSRKVLKKYFIMQQLMTDADLQISIGSPYFHDKNKNYSGISNLSTLKTKSPDVNVWNNIKQEMSSRMVKGKKRNNAAVASYIPMRTGLYSGVGRTMKIAIVKSHLNHFETYNGDTNTGTDAEISVNGSTKVNGIFTQWENYSYPGLDIGQTKKTIGLFPNGMSFTQIKHAEYVISNRMIRNSHQSQDKYGYNLKHIFYKMNRVADISTLCSNYLSARDQNLLPQLGYDIYQNINGELCKLQFGIKFENGEYHADAIWTSTTRLDENGNPIVVHTDNRVLNNVYDLWETLGGENSKSLQEDGSIDYSDASQIAAADLINAFDPSLKEQVVAKIADETAVKSGIININPEETMYNDDDFEYFTADCSRIGMQQDYSHEASESLIPALSQVITALAFNGENIELVNSIYSDLGQIIKNAFSKYVKHWDSIDHKGFHEMLAKQLFESLKTSYISSNAMDIVSEVLQAQILNLAAQGDPLAEKLPYSSREIFNKIASDFITELNHSALRQKFAGIAIVQNPSHGLVGIYRDSYGNRYLRTDLIDLANELIQKNPSLKSEGIYTNEDLVNIALNNARDASGNLLFANKDLTSSDDIANLNIGDSVIIIAPDGQQRIVTIDRPFKKDYTKNLKKSEETGRYNSLSEADYNQQFISLEEVQEIYATMPNIQLQQTFTKQSDLRPTIIKFREQNAGNLINFWTTEAVRNNLEDKYNKVKNNEHIAYYRANLKGIGDKNNPYYYRTIEDFKLDNKTYISEVEYTAGEQILPKVHADRQGLKHSIAYIKRKGYSYFIPLVQERFLRTAKVNNAFTLVTNESEISFTFEKPSESAEHVTLENSRIIKDGEEYYLQDELGNQGIKVPEPNLYVDTNQLSNGKLQYVIYLSEKNIQSEFEKPTEKEIANYIQDVVEDYNDVNSYYNELENSHLKKYADYKNEIDVQNERLVNSEVKKMAQKIYTSWELSNYTISARIPSQSFQSFMANETIAYIEENSNDGYVNVYELLFQGSKIYVYDSKLDPLKIW